MRRRIVFLDFDGCCNSLEEGSYVMHTGSEYGPSDRICSMLRKFCEETGSRIVITSNWRKFEKDGWYVFEGNKVYNPLGKLYERIGDLIDGTIPPERHIDKSKCLILWMEDNGCDVDYVIFDDDLSEGFQHTTDYDIRNHFICTDGRVGITEDDLVRARTILGVSVK